MNLVFLLIHSWRTLLYFTLVVKVCVCRIWWWLTTNVRYHLQWIYGNKSYIGETVYHSLPSHQNLLAHSLIGVKCQPLFGTWVYTPTWTPLILLRGSRRGLNSWNESLALHFSLHSGQHSWGKRDSRKVSLNIQLIYSPVLNAKDYGSWIPKGFYWSCDFLTTITIINFDNQVIFPSLPPQPPKSSITCDTVNSMLTQAPLQY